MRSPDVTCVFAQHISRGLSGDSRNNWFFHPTAVFRKIFSGAHHWPGLLEYALQRLTAYETKNHLCFFNNQMNHYESPKSHLTRNSQVAPCGNPQGVRWASLGESRMWCEYGVLMDMNQSNFQERRLIFMQSWVDLILDQSSTRYNFCSSGPIFDPYLSSFFFCRESALDHSFLSSVSLMGHNGFSAKQAISLLQLFIPDGIFQEFTQVNQLHRLTTTADV